MSLYRIGSNLIRLNGGGGFWRQPSSLIALRAPTGADVYVDPARVTNGIGSLASPYQPSQYTAAINQGIAPGQNLWFRQGSIAWPDTQGMQNGTSTNWVQAASYPGETCTLTFSGLGARAGGSQWLRMYNMPFSANLSTGNGNGLMLSQKGDFSGGTPSQNLWIINCGGTMDAGNGGVTDNSGLIRGTDNCPGLRILGGIWTGPTGLSNNQSLFWLDDQRSTQIMGAVLNGCANPLYFKHTDSLTQSDFTNMLVANNIFMNAGRAVSLAMNWCAYTNNAFYNCNMAMNEDGGGIPGGNNCTVNHNSFYNTNISLNPTSTTNATLTSSLSAGATSATLTADWPEETPLFVLFSNGDLRLCTFTGTGGHLLNVSWSGGLSSSATTSIKGGHLCMNNTFANNVLLGTSTYTDNSGGGVWAAFDQLNSIDYSAANTSNHYSRNSSSYTMSGYNGAFTPNEANGVSGTIAVAGGTTPGSNPSDWQLSPGSVGIGNASDGGDRGVNPATLLTYS